MVIFSGTSNQPLAQLIAARLGTGLAGIEITRFIDSECRVYVREDVRGKDIAVLQSLSTIADQHLVELCLIGSALRSLEAKTITAVIPWLGYSKQDRAFRTGEAVSSQLVARFIETAGFDRVIAAELHSANVLPYFRIPVTEVSTHSLLAEALFQHPGYTKEYQESQKPGGSTAAAHQSPGFGNAYQKPGVRKDTAYQTPGFRAGDQKPGVSKDTAYQTPGFGTGDQPGVRKDPAHQPPGFGNAYQKPGVSKDTAYQTPGFGNVIVVSPDKGGKSRSERFARETGLPVAYLAKSRDLTSGEVSVNGLEGDVEGKDVVIFDDIINTGDTAIQTSAYVKQSGARSVNFLAAHAVLAGEAPRLLQESVIDRVIVTDTIDITDEKKFPKLSVVSVADLLAEAIRS